MSRARDRLYLVRSVSLEDLNPADIKTKVLQHLQDPMPEGRSAISSGTSDGLFAKCQSGFEREVLTLLLEANYRVRPQVKAGGFFIDLVIEGAEDRRLAVELDGDANHGPEVWEKDMARQAALERAGWTFWRVFGSQWNAQKAYWWQDLKDTLTRMGIEPIGMGQLDERFTEFRTADSFLADPGVSSEAAAGAQTSPAAAQRAPANAAGSEDQPADWASTTRSLSGGAFVTAAAARPAAAPAEDEDAKSSRTPSWANVRDNEDNGHGESAPIDGQEPDDVTDCLDLDAAPEQDAWAPAYTSRVAKAPTLPGFGVGHRALPTPDPNRFYDASYRPRIQAIVVALIAAEGPITFKRLSDQIARAHGFQRTGKQISSTIWAASRQFRYVATPDGHKVFWPEDVEPRAELPFRGLMLNGERREWREVPHPEKLWLLRKALAEDNEDDLARAVADRIGIGRVTTQFRAEIAELEKQLEP